MYRIQLSTTRGMGWPESWNDNNHYKMAPGTSFKAATEI